VLGRTGLIEQPTAERAAHDIVALDGALAVGLDGIRDYAVLHDGRTIAITLLRAVGWLSRGDMPERKGHAGPALETPSAQCIGPRLYRYCVVPLAGEMSLALAGREIREFLSPARVVRGARQVGPLVEMPRDSVVQLSALRAGRDGAIVMRVFNPRATEASATIRFARAITSARSVDLREGDRDLGNTGHDVIRTAEPPSTDEAALRVRLAGYEIGTYLVNLRSR
jgi:alpha-mannosidase